MKKIAVKILLISSLFTPLPSFATPQVASSETKINQDKPQFTFQWHANEFHSQFFTLDSISTWNNDYAQKGFLEDWQKRFPLTDEDRSYLSRYRALRSRLPQNPGDQTDDRFPYGPYMLPPSFVSANDAFSLAFLRSRDLSEAINALDKRISSEDKTFIRQYFEHFAPRFSQLWSSVSHLKPARERLQAIAQKSGMEPYLQSVAKFYGSELPASATYPVELLWAPPKVFRATVLDGVAVVPFPEDEHDLNLVLGVVVHEFGHHLASQIPLEIRKQISNDIVELEGLQNFGHPNYFDEALQTAMANINFVKERLPESFDLNDSFYSYESQEEYPFMIDTLARRLAPLLQDAMKNGKPLYPNFFNAAMSGSSPKTWCKFSSLHLHYSLN